MKIRCLLPLLAFLCLVGCQEDTTVSLPPEIVVEGWIPEGGYPIVFVTSTVPVTAEDTPVDSLRYALAQWARVGIECDGDTTFLTGVYDEEYYPPYLFTTTAIKGQTGQRYHLFVNWRGMKAEATTTVPATVALQDIWQEPCAEGDTLRQIGVRFEDPAPLGDYYLLFSRLQHEVSNPKLCQFGVLDDAIINHPQVTMYARRVSTSSDSSPFYSIGNSVEVTLAHVDATAFAFWKDISEMGFLDNAALFSPRWRLEGNIQGGRGLWYGCGLSRRSIRVE